MSSLSTNKSHHIDDTPDPNRRRTEQRWSAKPCVEKHNFVCQHKMPYVSEQNRHNIYAKWNASYPNEMANEMEVIIDDRKEGYEWNLLYE